MRKILIALGIALTFTCLGAHAGGTFRGNYSCTECEFFGNITADTSEALEFIKSNNIMNTPSGPGKWTPGDTVAVCNVSICVTLQYTASGNFVPVKESPTPKTGFKNIIGPAGGKDGSGNLLYPVTWFSFTLGNPKTTYVTAGDIIPVDANEGGGNGNWGTQVIGGSGTGGISGAGGFGSCCVGSGGSGLGAGGAPPTED